MDVGTQLLRGQALLKPSPWPERPGASNNFRRSFRRSKASKLISVTFMSKLISDLWWDKKICKRIILNILNKESCFIIYTCKLHFYIKCLKVDRKFPPQIFASKKTSREFTGRLLVFCLQSCLSETFSQDFHVVTKLLASDIAQATTFVYTYLSPTESWGVTQLLHSGMFQK